MIDKLTIEKHQEITELSFLCDDFDSNLYLEHWWNNHGYKLTSIGNISSNHPYRYRCRVLILNIDSDLITAFKLEFI